MRPRGSVPCLVAGLLSVGCTPPATAPAPAVPAAVCPASHSPLVRAALFFGRGMANGGEVSDAAWSQFLDEVVTPRFPSGLSTLPANGQWRMADGRIIRERTWVVLLFYPATAATDSAINAITAEYKSRFQQEAVLQDRALTCTVF